MTMALTATKGFDPHPREGATVGGHLAAGSCPWRWCSFELAVTVISGKAGIDQAAMSGRLTSGLSLNVAMVSRLK